jgi:hypothetical protein
MRGRYAWKIEQVIDLAAVQHLAERRQAQSLIDATIGAATLGAAARARAEAASNHAGMWDSRLSLFIYRSLPVFSMSRCS